MNIFKRAGNFFVKTWQNIKNFCTDVLKTNKEFFTGLKIKISTRWKNSLSKFKQKNSKSKKEQNSPEVESQTEQTNTSSGTEQTSDSTEQNSSAEKSTQSKQSDTSEKTIRKPNKFIYVSANILDIFVDVLFAFAIFLRLKPDLFKGQFSSFFESISNKGKMITFFFKEQEPLKLSELPDNILAIFLIFLVLYFVLKLVFSILIAPGQQKLVAILLIFIEIFTISLVLDKFLIFLAFYILIYFTHQVFCKITIKTAAIKALVIIILDLILYLTIHIIFNSDILACFKTIFQQLVLPVNGLI